ncbi:hypothetical protein [Nocardioides mangrovi]|uniref:DUF222 domain-containing protein n=1 Tax=Nocardioides mangrovi TaxID=2874580 RepID=A0ABS7UJ54_9ACTN|nr:hypothetical protein [Nocardioides mangrovi]MBZ5741070.1 hypothetical protein [Nocardioides mangrovi]
MTISHALQDLRDSTARLSEAVTELVMISHEDRPRGSETAAVDAFAEQVSELQASVVEVGEELTRIDSTVRAADRMAFVDRAIASAWLRYWRDLRSYDATATMRRAARRGGPDWRAWQVTVEQSQQRCEQPLIDATTGARAVWMELAELVSIWLTHPPTHDAGVPAAENTRRST